MKAIRVEIEERNNKKHLVIFFIEIPSGEIIKESDVNVLDIFTFKMGTTQYDIPVYYRLPIGDINPHNVSDSHKKMLQFIENFGIISNIINDDGVIKLQEFSSKLVDVSIINQELELEILWEPVNE